MAATPFGSAYPLLQVNVSTVPNGPLLPVSALAGDSVRTPFACAGGALVHEIATHEGGVTAVHATVLEATPFVVSTIAVPAGAVREPRSSESSGMSPLYALYMAPPVNRMLKT